MDAMINQAHAAIINFTGQGGGWIFHRKESICDSSGGSHSSRHSVVAHTAAAAYKERDNRQTDNITIA